MRGSRVAESPVFCRRPLEPDAGNAAEGSEESEVPGGLPVISALRFPCMAMNTKKFRFNWRGTRGRVPKHWCSFSRNLVSANENDDPRDRGERAGARLRHQRAME